VTFTFCLLVFISYIFAIAFTQMAEFTTIGQEKFPNVMATLIFVLIQVTMPDLSATIYEIADSSLILAFFFTLFAIVAYITVMNMMVGVLVEVVTVVSSVEKEELSVKFVKSKLIEIMVDFGVDADCNERISREEFESLILSPKAVQAIQDTGVDAIGLVEFSDFLFQNVDELTFFDFFEIVLQFRGGNAVTMKDIVDLRKWTLTELTRCKDELIRKLGHRPQDETRTLGTEGGSNTLRLTSEPIVLANCWESPPQPPDASGSNLTWGSGIEV